MFEYAVYSLEFDARPMTPTEMGRDMGMPLRTVLDYGGRAFEARLTAAGLRAFHRANVAWNDALLDFGPALGMPVREVRRALHAIDDVAARTLRGLVLRSISRAG